MKKELHAEDFTRHAGYNTLYYIIILHTSDTICQSTCFVRDTCLNQRPPSARDYFFQYMMMWSFKNLFICLLIVALPFNQIADCVPAFLHNRSLTNFEHFPRYVTKNHVLSLLARVIEFLYLVLGSQNPNFG